MQTIGIPFNIIESVDSTNRLAMEAGSNGTASSGTTFFAMEQTAGRGQRGRAWHSQKGANIMMSILLEPVGLSPANTFPLSCVAALAASDLFRRHAGDETTIKWPNDLYWRDRKAGGILIENNIRGKTWRHAIVGYGININQTVFSPEIPNPVSLRQIAGCIFDSVGLAHELCRDVEQRLGELYASGFMPLLELFNQRCYGRGRRFIFRTNNRVFTAEVIGVNETGSLVTNGERMETHRFGTIEWLGPA
jgi:BirA family biotin operon repressor/biotin-[acetyl-CoA-carboxylase] ligase